MEGLKVVQTADGSSTLYSDRFNACYHSVNGALTESMHVFLKSGFEAILPNHHTIDLLEVGLGTCLNAALTAYAAEKYRVEVGYFGIELYPPSVDALYSTGYAEILEPRCATLWGNIVKAPPTEKVQISPWFSIFKIYADFTQWIPTESFDLIYFDAFAPDDQPEMWSLENFRKLFDVLKPNGALVTYSAKGLVKQNLRDAGFNVERLQGPPGKRHMVRAWKMPLR
ncbi:MAG: tRNA (5-methylaminomethyl-2-thiouridine)(34)-methyltransferase MnmD [Bacteroidota bacterium]